jgi:hypothetical protein
MIKQENVFRNPGYWDGSDRPHNFHTYTSDTGETKQIRDTEYPSIPDYAATFCNNNFVKKRKRKKEKVKSVMKTKRNCSTCVHGFQWGYESYSEYNFNCNLNDKPHSAYNFIQCDNWIRRTSKNAKKFEGAFYVSAALKFMDEQWIKIGKAHGW